MICSILGSPGHAVTGCGGPSTISLIGAAGRHHRIDVFKRRHADVQQIRAGLAHRFFQRGTKLIGMVDGAALEAVGAGELFGIRETCRVPPKLRRLL